MIPVLVDENNNKIYGDLSKQGNLTLNFGSGKNNIVFFAGASFGNFRLLFGGYQGCTVNNSLVFISENVTLFGGDLNIFSDCVFYVGRGSDMGNSYLWLSDCKNFIMGDDSMMSWELWFRSTDQHMIYDNNTHQRINQGKSIFIGDHVWGGYASSFMKGMQAFSGSIIGNRSVVTAKKFYSNTISAGNPCKERKKGVFWTRDFPDTSDKISLKKFDEYARDDFKFSFEKDKFLNPVLLDERLSTLETAAQKLEFVYDYIYNNTYKNRFALFEDSDTSACVLYKDESKAGFKSLEFNVVSKNAPLNVPEVVVNSPVKPTGAVLKVQNQLSYKLGQAMILNSKSLSQILKMPFILYSLYKEHKFEEKVKNANIKLNLAPKPLNLEEYADFNEALKLKNHLSYQLGQSLIKNLNNKYLLGGGFSNSFFTICLNCVENLRKNAA